MASLTSSSCVNQLRDHVHTTEKKGKKTENKKIRHKYHKTESSFLFTSLYHFQAFLSPLAFAYLSYQL